MIAPEDIRQSSPYFELWQPVFEVSAECDTNHFEVAVDNIVRNPGINSTVLLRADIYLEYTAKNGILCSNVSPIDSSWLSVNISDKSPRLSEIKGWEIDHYLVRRNIPRNPQRDAVTNQTCVMYSRGNDRFLCYFAHCSLDEMPFYLPKARGVGICYAAAPHRGSISVHYLAEQQIPTLDPSDRLIRIALHLLNTAHKHSKGVQTGYKKRVKHDQIIGRNTFQDRYILLKQKYAPALLENWVESTDPRKHVFEDLGIAAFLIELWSKSYSKPFTFCDVGCGNGLLVHILTMEGYHGYGVDIRERKSWQNFPQATRERLKEGIIMPPNLKWTLEEPNLVHIDTHDTFIIGNHCDELTLWIPLMGCQFMVMPCCSHALDGARTRFGGNKSQYQALVDKTAEISRDVGWKPEIEYLRIPSTRNAAIVGRFKQTPRKDVEEIVQGIDGDEWILSARKLLSKKSTH